MTPEINQVELDMKAREKAFRMLSVDMLKNKVKGLEGDLYRHPESGEYILKTENHREGREVQVVFQVFDGTAQVTTQKHLHGQDFEGLEQVNV